MPSFGRVSDFFDLTKGEIPLVRDHAKQTGEALEKAYQFTLWLIPTVEKFPRAQKFLLGDRIETARSLDAAQRNPGTPVAHTPVAHTLLPRSP